jgi:thiosulfate/3-mercaptopyruvate sulfurtransferase
MFVATYRSDLVWGIGPVLANTYSHASQLVDARSIGRFHGTEPEPRPGIRGGHVPGSLNLPYPELVNPDGTLKSAAELRARFAAAGVDPDQPVAALCGSGLTACAVLLALASLGNDRTRLYDGSWTEWGGRGDTPVATD